jgi:hypothetical protein
MLLPESADPDAKKGVEPSAAVSDARDTPLVKSVMDKVMYFATREKDKGVAAAATAVYGMLLRSLVAAARETGDAQAPSEAHTREQPPDPNASHAAFFARQALDDCIKEVFEKKKTQWSCKDLGTFAQRAADSLPELLLPEVLEKARTARSEYLQIEALKLCSVCFRYGPSCSCVCFNLFNRFTCWTRQLICMLLLLPVYLFLWPAVNASWAV